MEKVIVTGASRGLGRHCAMRLAEAGYHVIGMARSPDPEAPFEMRACDVSKPDEVESAFADLRRDQDVFGLVNAAAIASINLLVTTPPETVERIVATNLTGTILCAQAVSTALIRRRGGRIINFSTIAVPLALKGQAAYVASKAGVEAFSRTYAREMADYGVTVNVVAPGPVETRMTARVPADAIRQVVDRQIIPRQAEPEDVWRIVSLIFRPESAMITGQTFHVGGV